MCGFRRKKETGEWDRFFQRREESQRGGGARGDGERSKERERERDLWWAMICSEEKRV